MQFISHRCRLSTATGHTCPMLMWQPQGWVHSSASCCWPLPAAVVLCIESCRLLPGLFPVPH